MRRTRLVSLSCAASLCALAYLSYCYRVPSPVLVRRLRAPAAESGERRSTTEAPSSSPAGARIDDSRSDGALAGQTRVAELRQRLAARILAMCPELRSALVQESECARDTVWSVFCTTLIAYWDMEPVRGAVVSAIDADVAECRSASLLISELPVAVLVWAPSTWDATLAEARGNPTYAHSLFSAVRSARVPDALRDRVGHLAGDLLISSSAEERAEGLAHLCAVSSEASLPSLLAHVESTREFGAVVGSLRSRQSLCEGTVAWVLERVPGDPSLDSETIVNALTLAGAHEPEPTSEACVRCALAARLRRASPDDTGRILRCMPRPASVASIEWMVAGFRSAPDPQEASLWLSTLLEVGGSTVPSCEVTGLLQDGRPAVRRVMVHYCSDAETVEGLAVSDGDPSVRLVALRRLRDLGRTDASARLAEHLLFSNPPEEIRESLLFLLQESTSKGVFSAVLSEYFRAHADEYGLRLVEFWRKHRLDMAPDHPK